LRCHDPFHTHAITLYILMFHSFLGRGNSHDEPKGGGILVDLGLPCVSPCSYVLTKQNKVISPPVDHRFDVSLRGRLRGPTCLEFRRTSSSEGSNHPKAIMWPYYMYICVVGWVERQYLSSRCHHPFHTHAITLYIVRFRTFWEGNSQDEPKGGNLHRSWYPMFF